MTAENRSYRSPMKIFAAALVALAFAAPAAASPKLSPAQRAAITRSIDVFVNHAVKRVDAAAAFDVVAPEMRPGMTRKSWAHSADLPVYPFPARGKTHPWNILYVTREEVGLELQLQPARWQQAGADHLPYLPPAGRQALARRLLHAGRDPRAPRHGEDEGALGPRLLAAGGRRRRARRRRPAPAEQSVARRAVRAGRRRARRLRLLGTEPRSSANRRLRSPRGGALPPFPRSGP